MRYLLMLGAACAWMTTLVFAVECTTTGCDNEAASSSVGSCLTASYTACDSITAQNPCEYNRNQWIKNGNVDNLVDIREVRQDFPTSCLTKQAGSNCNEPLAHCYYSKVLCKWENGKCITSAFVTEGVSEKMRTTCTCKTGG